MKPPPSGWPRLSVSIFYDDPIAAIDWLANAFGFEVKMKIVHDNGVLVHSELMFGEAMMMVGNSYKKSGNAQRSWCTSPQTHGGAATQASMLYVDDADAHCARARAAGAIIASEPSTMDYGPEYWTDRGYEAVDPEGHHWWFIQRIR